MVSIVIATPTLIKKDAIGNDIIQEEVCLMKNGFPVFLYANNYDPGYKDKIIDTETFTKLTQNKKNILIIHHSIYWSNIEDIIDQSSCKIILKYHNITPPSFFTKYSQAYVEATKPGRDQTKRLAINNKISLFLGDSRYNSQELIDHGAKTTIVKKLAPFHMVDDFNTTPINIDIAREQLDGKINVLFVGRISPNKGHKYLVEIINRYIESYDRNIRLNFVGSFDTQLYKYYNEISSLIEYYDLSDLIKFKINVSFQDLHTYYSTSHAFLIISDHEGFCVPLLEAQYHHLPIISYNKGAVKETLGKNQICFNNIDYDLYASAIHTIAKNNVFRNYLSKQGQKNFNKYDNKILETKLLTFVNEI